MAEKNPLAEDAAGRGKKKILLLVVIGLLLLAGIGAGVFFYTRSKTPTEGEEAGATGKSGKTPSGLMVEIEPFIVNILDIEGTRYLKAAITLEVDGSEAVKEANERMPQIRDGILLLVSNKTFGEVSDLQGKLQLRAELINEVNSALRRGKVQKIYFTEFVVQ